MEQLVSVVIPVYNVEQYLRRCLDSVIGQTYKHLEIILIDDGSTDLSGAICDEYALKDERIKVCHIENGGQSIARNKGVSLAAGQYLVFIDSDDYVSKAMIDVMVRQMQQDKSDLVICNFLRTNSEGQILTEQEASPVRNELLSTEDTLNKLIGPSYWYFITVWNRLYRTSMVRQFPFPENQIIEDEMTAHHLLGECQKVSCIEQPLYYYTQSENSTMRGQYSVHRLNVVTAMWDRCSYASKRQLHELAESSMDRGMFFYLEGMRRLDRQDVMVIQKFRQLRHQYRDAYRQIDKTALSFKKRCLYLLFLLNDRLYNKLDSRVHS